MGKALARRIKCTILYGTETGKSEGFSKTLCQIFKHAFDAKVRFVMTKLYLKTKDRTLNLVLYFWSFEIRRKILRNQKDSYSILYFVI